GYLDTLRTLSGLEKATNDKRYEVWTYHGGIPVSVLEQAIQELESGEQLKITDAQKESGAEIDGIIVMSGNGKILSVNLNPVNASEFPYSVYTCEPDVACVFGFGIPYL
ncbi:hypothetical protein NM947_12860, partial [Pasteurella multocida]|nr:hypothetical protein [Pasteurella multocida]MDA5614383.1 hypothetical protein [Pasteurella multocida]